jgi:hypothetical protein
MYSPGEQRVQDVRPSGTCEAEKLPGWHGLQTCSPVELANLPVGQTVQVERPPAAAYMPRGQGAHRAWPSRPAKRPTAQGWQLEALLGLW